MSENQSNFEPMVIFEFGLFCKVVANGKSGYALIDTGATSSGVSPALAKDLTPIKQSTSGGAHGKVQTNIFQVSKLELLGQSFQDVRASEAQAYKEFPGEVLMRLGNPELLARPIVFDFKQLKFGFKDNLEMH
jgi:Aspartyl protease